MRQLVLLLVFAAVAGADTITSSVSGDVEGVPQSDSDTTTAFNDPILAEITYAVSPIFGNSGIAYARAAQNITVIGAKGGVAVDTVGIFASGPSIGTLSATNTLVSVAPTPGFYEFSMFLTGAQLRILDFVGAGAGLPGAPTASFAVTVDLLTSGGATSLFSASATLNGGFVSHSLTETGTDLGGTFFANSLFDFGYDFDPLFRNFVLGGLDAGDMVVYTMEVSFSALPVELGGSAIFGDPNDLDGAGSSGLLELVGGGPGPGPGSAPVPEPATLVLLGAAVCGLAYRRWRRPAAATQNT